MAYRRVLVFGCMAVVLLDILAMLASVALDFPMSFAFIGSIAIYMLVGSTARQHASLTASVLAGCVVGFADATLGSGLSRAIVLGLPPLATPRSAVLVATITVLAGIAAAVGARLEAPKPGPRDGHEP